VIILPQESELEEPAPEVPPTPKVPPPPPPATISVDPEAFFAKLPPDSFRQDEEKLRAALTGLLAQGAMPAAQVARDPQVRAAARNLLPRSVQITDWVERRIGGEVLVGEESKGQMMRLTPASKEERKEAFFSSLPSDSFTEEEEDLRATLFDFMATWKSKDFATLSNLNSDKTVQQVRARLLPPGVTFHEWIVRRIGGEVELKPDRKGNFIVHLTEAAKPFVNQRFKDLEEPGPVADVGDHAVQEGGRSVGAQDGVSYGDDWFEGLPADDLLPPELDLREALLNFLDDYARKNSGNAPDLATAVRDKAVQRSQVALLPPGVALQSWIARRIGGEVQTRPQVDGTVQITLRDFRRDLRAKTLALEKEMLKADPVEDEERDLEAEAERELEREAARALASEKREAFFDGLPPDALTAEEEGLREALLNFLEQWDADEPPTLSNAGGDIRVHNTRHALMPKDSCVSLKEWIDRRIGGEVETSSPRSGGMPVVFGLRGGPHDLYAAGLAAAEKAVGKKRKMKEAIAEKKAQRAAKRELDGEGGSELGPGSGGSTETPKMASAKGKGAGGGAGGKGAKASGGFSSADGPPRKRVR